MAHLIKPPKYEIEGSNIELFGSEIEKKVHEHAGDAETAWADVGNAPGVRVWRIEAFRVVPWPAERLGTFYDGDSYIVLHTYKKSPDAEGLAHDIHFWLGHQTSQDEAGTAAYKTVELDDHLHGEPVQYREVQGFESARFLSYFPRFTSLHGGVSTGFHHVTAAPPVDARRLYRITGDAARLAVREVPADGASLVEGDAYIFDRGAKVWQLNTSRASGKEKFAAAELAHTLADARRGACAVEVFDEGGRGASKFLAEFGLDALPQPAPVSTPVSAPAPALFRITDTGFSEVPTARAELVSDGTFVLDVRPAAVYVWVGRAVEAQARLALQHAHRFLQEKPGADSPSHTVLFVKIREGSEPAAFWKLLGA